MAHQVTVAQQSKRKVMAASRRGLLQRVAAYWDLLAVLVLMLASLPLAWLAPRALVVIRHPGTFDDHWVLDTVLKASRGIWYLRDAVFLYGPLGHWLLAAPARIAGLSMGSIYTSYNTLLLWCSFWLGYLTLRLLLPEQPAWKRFVLLLLLQVFWAPWDGRTAFAIFLFAAFLRGWYALRNDILPPLLFGAGAAVLCALGFLYSADTGVYGVAALFLALAGVAWEGRREEGNFRLYVLALGAFSAAFVLLVFFINTVVGAPLDFRFWKSALALVSVHRWNEPAAISEASAYRLGLTLLGGGLAFLVRWVVRGDTEAAITPRSGFLLSAFLFALLAMQSGLVRSDPMHIVFAAFPMMFFVGAILFSFSSRIVSVLAVLAAIALSVTASQPAPIFRPANLRYRLGQMRHPLTQCPDGFSEVDRACYPVAFASLLQSAPGYLQEHSREQDAVLIFPYQYMFGVAARRSEAAAVEQAFLAVGPYLTQLDIDRMSAAAAPVGLYFPDGELSLAIDGVANFTRTPDLWLWIVRHYRSNLRLAPDVIGLQKDDSRSATVTLDSQTLLLPAKEYSINTRSATIDLGEPFWPPPGADFVRLRLRVNYGFLWKLRKPEHAQLEITRADGTRTLQPFVIEPNHSADIWFYPWEQDGLADFFDPDPSRWRPLSRSPVRHLRLQFDPLDWVSQQPASVSIEAADGIRLQEKPRN